MNVPLLLCEDMCIPHTPKEKKRKCGMDGDRGRREEEGKRDRQIEIEKLGLYSKGNVENLKLGD